MGRLVIKDFQPPFDFLSNFAPAIIIVEGNMYPTVEHAYQAYKSLRPQDREWVRHAPDPREAKKRGRKVVRRDDFDLVKIPFMRIFVTMKFTMYADYRQRLSVTGDALIEEGNWWGDTFWGICKGVGENNLGKILMEVRDTIRLMAGAAQTD